MSATKENSPRPRFRSNTDRLLPGLYRTVVPALPQAGQDWSVQVPGGRLWRVCAVLARFQASAVIASRLPQLFFNIAGVNVAMVMPNVAWTANVQWGLSGSFDVALTHVATGTLTDVVPLPKLWLPGGDTFGPTTVNLDAGDRWTAVALQVEEHFGDNMDIELHRQAENEELAELIAGGPPTTPGG